MAKRIGITRRGALSRGGEKLDIEAWRQEGGDRKKDYRPAIPESAHCHVATIRCRAPSRQKRHSWLVTPLVTNLDVSIRMRICASAGESLDSLACIVLNVFPIRSANFFFQPAPSRGYIYIYMYGNEFSFVSYRSFGIIFVRFKDVSR